MRTGKEHGSRAGWPLLLMIVLAACVRVGVATEAVDPFVHVKRLGRGVNVVGHDPIWRDFHQARFKEWHFQLIHDAGFQSVRINLHALRRLKAANGYKLDDAWLQKFDWAVK